MAKANWKRVAIVGVGLIGGSIGKALLARRLAGEVVGIGRRASSLAIAKRAKAVSTTTTDLAKGIAGADLVVVCTPVEQIVPYVEAIAKQAEPNSKLLITDAGSTKAEIVQLVEELQRTQPWPKGVRFVGSHPIAGNEKRGAQHGSAELFVGRTVVMTPGEQSSAADLRDVKRFWAALGAKVVSMSPEDHDAAMAVISHLPHLLSSAIAASTPERYVSLSGTGWQDTTRIAAGDPELWRQILLTNRDHVLAALSGFEHQLQSFREALQSADPKVIERLLSEGKKVRDSIGGK